MNEQLKKACDLAKSCITEIVKSQHDHHVGYTRQTKSGAMAAIPEKGINCPVCGETTLHQHSRKCKNCSYVHPEHTFREGDEVQASQAYGGKKGRVTAATDDGYIYVQHGKDKGSIYKWTDLNHRD